MRNSLNNLDALCYATGARIVFTTDWRHSHTRGDLTKLLKDLGITFHSPPEQTPILPGDLDSLDWWEPRLSEIQTYIALNGVVNFVVLDDMVPLANTELAPRLVLCDFDEGFTEAKLKHAIEILSR